MTCEQYHNYEKLEQNVSPDPSNKNKSVVHKSRALWKRIAAVAIMVVTLGAGASWPRWGRARPRTVLSCYYNSPEGGNARALLPTDLRPDLCTHINVGFATVLDKRIELDDNQIKALTEVVKLRKINPQLKILLSVGGSGPSDGFSGMVVDHASRKIFIKSIKSILRNYILDGIDLDWEFPGVHDAEGVTGKRERQHFSQLLREIRAEYIREKRNYLLTVAVACPETIVDVAYDVDQLNIKHFCSTDPVVRGTADHCCGSITSIKDGQLNMIKLIFEHTTEEIMSSLCRKVIS